MYTDNNRKKYFYIPKNNSAVGGGGVTHLDSNKWSITRLATKVMYPKYSKH